MAYINNKKYKIVLSPEFSYEVTNIYNYFIFNFKEPQIAKNLRRKITIALSSLQFFPSRHLNLNNFINSNHKNLHRILIDRYVLIYNINYTLR